LPNLNTNFCGIKSPNPFWLASAPPTNTGYQIMRAFEYGWGGAVWKTLGKQVKNVSSRLGAHYYNQQLIGFNNIELISDRSLNINFKEMNDVKYRFPNNALIASLMVETKEEWKNIIKMAEDAGADGLELNFGCPHGMCEKGMGSAVGQEPKILKELISWVIDFANIPVIVKLTPNISNINIPGEAAVQSGAHGLSLINTIKSITSVNLNLMIPNPIVKNISTNGGYSGAAVKPIALYMIGELSRNQNIKVPLCGIGGITNWQDAAEFIALGSTCVQICSAVMQNGYRIIEGLINGLSNFLYTKNMSSITELIGLAVPNFKNWNNLDKNYNTVAKINKTTCIECQLCYISCRDAGHQCIDLPFTKTNLNENNRIPIVQESKCVGCNLCKYVCPIENCITMHVK